MSALPATTRRPTRTLLLVPEIFSSEGGIPRILRNYLRALCDLGGPDGTVRLLALNDPSFPASAFTSLPPGRLESAMACGRRKGRLIREALRLSRGCDRLVCGHLFLLPVAWILRRLRPGLRYHVIAHGIEVWRPLRWRERLALRDATSALCVSAYTRGELLRRCPLPEDRALVLPNALDPSFPLHPGRPLATCEPIILTVTRLSSADRYKGVDHLIAALPQVREALPQARLRIIGRGDDLARLEGLARQAGVASAVDFAGYVEDDRLREELASCRLFALPSNGEGFGLVYLEAMAHGRPCLAARAGGAPEVLTDATGMLVDYGDVPGLARAAITALQRAWDSQAILDQVEPFTYPAFVRRLSALLPA
ncbi:MAG: glycosyltransferase family 4 protein [Verrucomicrobia bacterium]|nr:glycosyltransferase family 4 protein [Verrucomicrobiota bacterium]